MYYLHHYFDPDFSHMNLTPREASDGSIDYRYLGYVQNVVAGQALAEIKEIDGDTENRDARFIYSERRLPVGPNTALHEKNPNIIISTCNGYVFYHKGLISVKKLLNIRGNVGFHTGNILFVGDLAVHGDIQTGFAVSASNILVKRHIESAKVKSANNIVCLEGVKGTEIPRSDDDLAGERVIPSALLDAGGSIRLPFCERVQLRARGNLVIDGSCIHSTLYVGGNLIIRGRLQGGEVYANGLVYVEKQLGYDYETRTKIMMGYDPFNFLLLQKIETQIRDLKIRLDYFKKRAERNAVMEQEFTPRAEIALRKLEILHAKREALWDQFVLDEKMAGKCRLVVPGVIMPGCEISVGVSYYRTEHDMHNTTFRLVDGEVIHEYPAMSVSHDLLNNKVSKSR